VLLRPFRQWRHDRARRRLATRHLHGEGLEIGALHRPFPLPAGARVRYVDRWTTAQLREEYPGLAGEPLAEVSVVDDAQRLATIADATQDFVVAGHVLEHTEDPIGALQAQLRVLRPGGVLVLALPDRRRDLDALREPTSLEHLLADHREGPARSRAAHYREWSGLVDRPLGLVAEADVEAHAAQLERGGHDIHFHCWTLEELVAQLPAFGLPADLAEARRNGDEFLLVLRRRAA
jgi:SAM-dependent methyltransferase